MSRTNLSVIWDHFEKLDDTDKKARCRVCGDLYSYKGTTGNLKAHLKKKHLAAYTQVSIAQLPEKSGPQTASTDESVPAITKSVEGPSTSTFTPVVATSSSTSIGRQQATLESSTPMAEIQRSPRRTPRSRLHRRRRELALTQKAARRTIIRYTERRLEIEEAKLQAMNVLLTQMKEIKEALISRFGEHPTIDE